MTFEEDFPELQYLYKILENEGLKGWRITTFGGGGGLCEFDSKIIRVDFKKYKEDSLFMFLHEVAHAKLGEEFHKKYGTHTASLADNIVALCKKYSLDKAKVKKVIDKANMMVEKPSEWKEDIIEFIKKELGLKR